MRLWKNLFYEMIIMKIVVGITGASGVIYGIRLLEELKKADSQIAGTVAQSPVNIGKKAVDIALDILEGKDFEKETSVDVFMINKENVEMYGADGWQ